jgi:hypothetical protein
LTADFETVHARTAELKADAVAAWIIGPAAVRNGIGWVATWFRQGWTAGQRKLAMGLVADRANAIARVALQKAMIQAKSRRHRRYARPIAPTPFRKGLPVRGQTARSCTASSIISARVIHSSSGSWTVCRSL